MSRYTVKSFSGSFTFVAMDSPSDFFRFTTPIKLSIKFNNGLIDETSKNNLLKLIESIQHDVKQESKFIVPYWYDNRGKVECIEKEFDDSKPNDPGRIISTTTSPLTSVREIEDFVAYLYACANIPQNKVTIYTPLLNSKSSETTAPEIEEDKPIAQNGIVARVCRSFRCFG